MKYSAFWTRGLWTCAAGVLALALGASEGMDARARQNRKTVWDGVYTAEQARRGLQTYTSICMYCHGPDLLGEEMGPSLKGSSFFASWRNEPLTKLFIKIHETMPYDDPGTLTPEAAVDVMTYLLQQNEIPAGKTELAPKAEALDAVVFTEK